MVVLQGDLLERPGSPVRRLAGLLRQHDYKQGLDGYVTRLGGVRFGSHRRVRVYRRASDVAQPLGLPEAIGRLGSLLHLPALRNGQHAIAPSGYPIKFELGSRTHFTAWFALRRSRILHPA